jgi:hypothetical protein
MTTTVWGLIGMLGGVEISRNYAADPSGKLESQAVLHLTPGQITAVSPRIGDIDQVENALTDRASLSIHAYGSNIGALARHVYLLDSGETKPFVSGYANDRLQTFGIVRPRRGPASVYNRPCPASEAEETAHGRNSGLRSLPHFRAGFTTQQSWLRFPASSRGSKKSSTT